MTDRPRMSQRQRTSARSCVPFHRQVGRTPLHTGTTGRPHRWGGPRDEGTPGFSVNVGLAFQDCVPREEPAPNLMAPPRGAAMSKMRCSGFVQAGPGRAPEISRVKFLFIGQESGGPARVRESPKGPPLCTPASSPLPLPCSPFCTEQEKGGFSCFSPRVCTASLGGRQRGAVLYFLRNRSPQSLHGGHPGDIRPQEKCWDSQRTREGKRRPSQAGGTAPVAPAHREGPQGPAVFQGESILCGRPPTQGPGSREPSLAPWPAP